MDQNLVTIATFQSPLEASLAKNRLAESGITATLSGEEAVSMAWFLTNAVGGVKLQVSEADAAKAVAALEGDEPTLFDQAPIASEAIQPPGSVAAAGTVMQENEDEEEEPPRNQRELNADRACMATLLILILLVLPIGIGFAIIMQFYLCWLLIKVYLSPEPLRTRYRVRFILAIVVNIPFVIAVCVILRNIIGG